MENTFAIDYKGAVGCPLTLKLQGDKVLQKWLCIWSSLIRQTSSHGINSGKQRCGLGSLCLNICIFEKSPYAQGCAQACSLLDPKTNLCCDLEGEVPGIHTLGSLQTGTTLHLGMNLLGPNYLIHHFKIWLYKILSRFDCVNGFKQDNCRVCVRTIGTSSTIDLKCVLWVIAFGPLSGFLNLGSRFQRCFNRVQWGSKTTS